MRRDCLDIVVLATADWDATLWTNKQHTARSLRDHGHRVLYVESVGLRPPRLNTVDLLRIAQRLKRMARPPRLVEDRIWCWSPPSLPWQRYTAARLLNRAAVSVLLRFWSRRVFRKDADLVWTYNPMTTALVRLPKSAKLAYHCVDDVAAQPSMPATQIRKYESELVARAANVFVTSRRLESTWSRVRPVTYLPNCVDSDHFAAKAADGDPLAGIPAPRLGFVGAVSSFKLDTELLADMCASNPSWSLVMVGPLEDADDALTKLLKAPNVYYLGPKSYAEIPTYMHAMDVGLIPARLTQYAMSMFPMKFFEYLAAGLPVVATELPALAAHGDVAALVPAPMWDAAIGAALAGLGSTPASRVSLARRHSYTERTARMLRELGVDSA
jgi:glycosyltransferase involved in cell wall biosynthesis